MAATGNGGISLLPPWLSAKEDKSLNFCFYLRFSFSFWFHLVIMFLWTFVFNLLSYHPVCFRRLFRLPTFLSYCTGWIYSPIHTYTQISYLGGKLKSTRSSQLAPTHYSIPVAGVVTSPLRILVCLDVSVLLNSRLNCLSLPGRYPRLSDISPPRLL